MHKQSSPTIMLSSALASAMITSALLRSRAALVRTTPVCSLSSASGSVSGMVYEMYDGARTVGNQIHTNRSRIDFNPIKFTEEIIEDLFHKANEVIESNLTVTDSIMTREQINAIMPPDRTNMDLLPISVKKLRVVKIGDNVDLCPCAGTHVRALGEIGEMKFLSRKNKGKGTTRVSYTLEGCES